MKSLLAVLWIVFLLDVTQISARPQEPFPAQSSLITPGSEPFHLKAVIADRSNAASGAEVEIYWVNPLKWRRTITSHDFTQTVIVNGKHTYDRHSDNYVPIKLNALVSAMVDPQSRVADCGYSIRFSSYEDFDGKPVARKIFYSVPFREVFTATISKLEPLKKTGHGFFAIRRRTSEANQLQVARIATGEMQNLAVKMPEIIWPQVLDGAQTGEASFCASIDTKGLVREVLPVRTANERSNDSAIRQIMRWKLDPAMQNGRPVQAEGLLTFTLNTRKYGPSDTLDDAQMRKLATNVVPPDVPAGSFPSGTEYKIWLAVDSDGIVIEQITASGPPELMTPCGRAIGQWHFKPIMENGKPRPYRGLVVFRF